MGLQEPDQCREKRWIGCSFAKLISPDSGQVKEPARPPFVGNSGGKRNEPEGASICWRGLTHRLRLYSKFAR